MESDSGMKLWRPALRGALLFIAFLFLSRLTYGIIMLYAENTGEKSFFVGIPAFAFNALAFAGTLLIFSSFSNLFSVFDAYERESFFEKGRISLKTGELFDILKSRNFILETSVCLTLTFFAALFGIFPELSNTFFADSSHRVGYFSPLILVPLCFIISLFTKYEARRYWYELYLKHDLDTLSVPKFILTLSAILFMYPTVFPLAPILVFMVITAFGVFIKISKVLTLLGTVTAIFFLVILVLGISYTRAILNRRKFLKRLRETCAKNNYRLSPVRNPYKSFFKSEYKESFTIIKDNQVFECTLISTVDRLVPLVFTSATDAQFTRRIGTKKHHIDINHPISFFPGGDGKQIIIINPTVKFLFVTDGIKVQEIEGPQNLWNFTLYRDYEFLGALERGHVGKV